MKSIFTLLLVLFSLGASAQTLTIRGRISGADDKQPLIGAYVAVNAHDSVRLSESGRIVATDNNGTFVIKTKDADNVLTFSYLGYQTTLRKIDRPSSGNSIDLGMIELEPGRQAIEAVQIIGEATMAKIKGDTVQYSAAAFKTNPDASTEDLLKKMPGVTVNESGGIESQGQTIAKVYVNGKEYFNDDPSLALKSLPVDAVESIQMYDDQSETSKFSGFDDGERVRSINIVTKKGVMNSTFGKVYGGYGTDNRYSGGVGLNSFNDTHRWTLVAQSNNVNNQGFTLSDIASSMGGGGGRSGGGADVGSFTTSARGGVATTNMIGLNYNGNYGTKGKLSGSYFFSGRESSQDGTRVQNFLNLPRYYDEKSNSQGYDYSHRLQLRGEWNPNERNRFNFNPRVTYSTNRGSSGNEAQTFLGQGGQESNASINSYKTNLRSYNASADLWWQHRFRKAGRTMSLGGRFNARKALGTREQLSQYGSLNEIGDGWVTDELRQIGSIMTSGYTIVGSGTYSEPISKSSRLSLNYNLNYDRSISDQEGLNWDKALQDYTLLDTTTTNYFNRNYITQTAGIGYNLTKGKKISLTANVNYQYATLNNDQQFPINDQSSYSFSAILPRLRFAFTPKQGQSFNVDYYANSIFPSVTQLQDLLNTTNPLQVSKGNANLKQSYSNQIMIRYNYANTARNWNFNIFGNATQTDNYISNHRIFLTKDTVVNGTLVVRGAQFTTPVNLQGYMNAGLFTTFSFGIKPIKSNMSASLFYRYQKSPSMQDYVKYMSTNNRIGARLSLNSNISENVDFTVAYNPSISLSTAGTGNFDRYQQHDLSLFMNIFLFKGFFINADATWKNTFGTQKSYTQHYGLLNAAIGYKFLKYRQAEVRLQGYDLLNQNRSFRQSTTDTYIQTTTETILKRYYMFSFTYKFDTRKNRSAENFGKDAKDNVTRSGMGGGMRGH